MKQGQRRVLGMGGHKEKCLGEVGGDMRLKDLGKSWTKIVRG